ncbi:acyl carrier protein [Candidatus Omnitrophota bacterium]
MSLSEAEIIQLIKKYVSEHYRVGENELNNNINLFEAGIIDSMGVFDLATFLEQSFEVKLEEEHFFDSRSRSIQGMAAIVKEIKDSEEQESN